MRKWIFYIAAAIQVIAPFFTALVWGYASVGAFFVDILTGVVNALLWFTAAQLWVKVKQLEEQ